MNRIAKRTKRRWNLLILSVVMLAIALPASFAAAADADVEGHWAEQEIKSWIAKGYIKGYEDGSFKPNNAITRAEFTALVNRSFGLTESEEVAFNDLQQGAWYVPEVGKAKKAKYILGYEDGSFKPNALITRQEAAAIVVRLKTLQESGSDADSFADASNIPAWSKGYIGAAAKAGFVQGYPDGTFRPANNITRAEAVMLLNNALDKETGASSAGVTIEAIADQKLQVNGTAAVTLKTVPADAVITVQSSDNTVATATLNGDKVELKGLKAGTATVTVTAKKDGLADGVISFKVTVENPVVIYGGGGPVSPPANSKPVITVVEPDGTNDGVIQLQLGAVFTKPTVTATDAEDGTLTASIVRTGEDNVDTSKTGEYVLTYNVKDSKGLAADEKKVTVKVQAVTATVQIEVDVAEALPSFKKITVKSATHGEKFMVEGTDKKADVGGSIEVTTGKTELAVTIFNTAGNVIGRVTVDVRSDNTKDYTFTVLEKLAATIRVEVAEALPSFKRITVTSVSSGTQFMVEGSSSKANVGNPIEVTTSETELIVTILDAAGEVLAKITVDVSADNTKEYLVNIGGTTNPPVNQKPVIAVVEPDGTNDGVITLRVGTPFTAPTVTASDAEDGGLTNSIIKTGENLVDVSKAGEYVLKYNVSDSKGLAADERTVTVKVVPAEAKVANIEVNVAEALPSFKRIKVISAAGGAKFKVEGSSAIANIGGSIEVTTGKTELVVTILDAAGAELGKATVNVQSDNTKDYVLQ